MIQKDGTRTVLASIVLLLTLGMIVATFSGAVSARSLTAPGNCTTSALFHEGCSQDGELLITAADTSEQSQELGICMIGVSSECNSNEWENSSLSHGDAERDVPFEDSPDTADNDTEAQFTEPDVDVEFEATTDDETNSSATRESQRLTIDESSTID